MFLFLLFFSLLDSSKYEFFETFENEESLEKWIKTKVKGYDGIWFKNSSSNFLTMETSKARFAITKNLEKPINMIDKDLIIQYEVLSPNLIDCAGGYFKLYGPEKIIPTDVSNDTNYIIMFGPDKCGSLKKVHFIFKHFTGGKFYEKNMKIPPEPLLDNKTHVYSLIIRKDNTFQILIDSNIVRLGNLLNDFDPPVNLREIPDPTDKKPSDWIDDEYVIDETAKKPDDWDEDEPEFIPDPDKLKPPKGWLLKEPKTIRDPNAKKPIDWDDDVMGEWEAPMISNPKCDKAKGCGKYEPPLILNEKYKGKWEPPRYRNPLYKGPWRPRMIMNPNYKEDLHPHNMQNITAVGFELWAVTPGVGFRNIIISHDVEAVLKWTEENYHFKENKEDSYQQKGQKEPGNFLYEDDDDISFLKDFQKNNLKYDFEKQEFIKNENNNNETFLASIMNFWKEYYEKDKQVAISMFCTIVFIPLISIIIFYHYM